MDQRLILVRAAGAETARRWVSARAFVTGRECPTAAAEVVLDEEIDANDQLRERFG
jgi:hypothetical protein